MSFVLPNPSTGEHAHRDYYHHAGPASSTAAAPVASTSAAPMSSGVIGLEGSRRTPASGRPATRRKGKGKGRTMSLKIFYSLNSPRLGTPSSSSTTPQLLPASTPTPDFLAVLDPALAPSPNPPVQDSPSQATNYSCMARLSAPVWVQIVGGRRGADGEDAAQFGRITLKTCLSAICISRPELVFDPTKDFSVSAVDPYESSHQRQAPGSSVSGTATASRPGEGLVEGKGMLSWSLAEKKEGTTMVCGKIVGPSGAEARKRKRRRFDDGNTLAEVDDEDEDSEGDEPEETLEIWLQLTERDAFTQGQFLDALRSYHHNPVQHLQNEISDFASSPPKRQESAVFPPADSAPRQSTSSTGDPVKRKRPRESPVLPLPSAPPSTTSLAAPFATGPAESSPATFPAPLPTLDSAFGTDGADLQDPRNAAVLNQLLASLSSGAGADGLTGLLPSSLPLDSPQLLPALQTLAKYYGLDLPGQQGAASSSSSTPFPASADPAPSSAPAPAPAPASTAAPATGGGTTRRRTAKDREHFVAIDLSTLAAPPTNKQNPRDANGCSNCRRKKSTTWREGTASDGTLTTVCNACGTFYNKNGYHRNKPGQNAAAETSPPQQQQLAPKGGRPLQGRLTATCEADLQRKVKKHKVAAGVVPGVIPPLSPSKHVGPRSPALKFDFGSGHRSVGRSTGVVMSSPGRSPRLRYRSTVVPYPATSPLRGSTLASTSRAAATSKDVGADYESDGEERGPHPQSFGSLFGLNGSPSPVRIEQRPASGGKGMPSYLLSASPGTALDRILNDTNIGSIGGMSGAAPVSDAMQLEEAAATTLDDDFSFFLQPHSPTTRGNKENARPRAGTASATDGAPTTDPEAFESILSSLRRDFNTRLSSNALTAPSSPAPSSPCVLPRTSTATPGSKGKAPQSGGREPPSILEGFMSSLVPGLVFDAEAGGAASTRQHLGLTPASDSDAWSPADAHTAQHDHDLDQTLTLDSFAGNSAKSRPPRSSTQQHGHEHDKSRPSASKNVNRRAPFIPAHLLAPSDATEFDYGSLPPSSPPQLPSEAFPTPSDFDGITPSADGGDNDEQRAHVGAGGAGAGGAEPLSIEAVAAHVAREPDVDARKGMIALLQSLSGGAGSTGIAEHVHLAGTGNDQIQLDRGTVNRLLALISAKSPAGEATADDVSPTPASAPVPARPTAVTSSSTSSDKRSAATTKATAPPAVAHEQAHPQPDLSHFDFDAFATGSSDASTTAAARSFGAGGQLSELYTDLFSDTPQF